MTDQQLYLAIGIPCLTILASMVLNMLQIFAIRGDVKDIRGEMKDLRTEVSGEMKDLRTEVSGEMKDLRAEVNTKLDLILAKFYEHDAEIARLKEKAGLR